jgi:multiple sugar transport system ATP-binding protein
MNLIASEVESLDGKPVLHLTHTDVSIRLSDKQMGLVRQGASSHELVFGVRPEHTIVSKEPVEKGVKAAVHLVEALGSVNIIDIFLGENSATGDFIFLRARTHPAFRIDIGQLVWLDFDAKHIHLFDRYTEKAIC